MLRILAPMLLFTVLIACSGDNGTGQQASPTLPVQADAPAGDCVYELHDDLTGDSSFLDAFPSELQPTALFERGEDLLITVDDPDDPGRDLTLVVPACKRVEAQPFLEGLSP